MRGLPACSIDFNTLLQPLNFSALLPCVGLFQQGFVVEDDNFLTCLSVGLCTEVKVFIEVRGVRQP